MTWNRSHCVIYGFPGPSVGLNPPPAGEEAPRDLQLSQRISELFGGPSVKSLIPLSWLPCDFNPQHL